MARDKPATNEARAEVSLRSTGRLYVGRKARDRLGLGTDDQVRVTVPSAREGIETVKGFLDSSNHIQIGVDSAERLANGFGDESTVRVDGIVEPGCLRWEEIHGLTENRWDGYHTLDIKG